jgi:hypothetical protein
MYNEALKRLDNGHHPYTYKAYELEWENEKMRDLDYNKYRIRKRNNI